jgi:hypothetical protein
MVRDEHHHTRLDPRVRGEEQQPCAKGEMEAR